jgi:hypothetical protein
MLFSALLTLFIVPAAYILLDRIAIATRGALRGLGDGGPDPVLDVAARETGDR